MRAALRDMHGEGERHLLNPAPASGRFAPGRLGKESRMRDADGNHLEGGKGLVGGEGGGEVADGNHLKGERERGREKPMV